MDSAVEINKIIGDSLDIDFKTEYSNPLLSEMISRGYSIPSHVTKNRVMFIGMNPSFVASDKNWESIQYFGEVKQLNNEYPIYYRRFEDIHKQTQLEWTHWDLLFFRQRNQATIVEIKNTNEGKALIKKQLQLSKQIIDLAVPKVIVVSNAKAREYFKNEMGYEVKFDEKLGTHLITNEPLKNTPVFFTSMLTGQSPLDNGSYERLIWHIKFVLSMQQKNIK